MSGTRRVRPSAGAAITSSPWIVVSIGVLVMVVLLVVALTSARGRRAYPDAAPPSPAMPLPALPLPTTSPPAASASAPAAPGLSARSTPSRAAVSPSRATPSPSARPTASGGGDRPAAAPPSPVTGRYRVVNRFADGLIGEVRMVNGGDTARGWTVRVSFAQGRYVTSWVESAEQGTASFADGVLTYRSGVDVAPGASVSLRFHFEDTVTTQPASCTVDGAPCSE